MKKKYADWTNNQLIQEFEKFSQKKKYGLVWEDKQENVVLECESKYPILVEEKKMAMLDDKKAGQQNILIEGDNYHALQVLSYTHRGKIDVIYIDPPYNTGNKDFIYNDSYVDKEDSYRHSKWLSFVERRLKLAKSLLSESGAIFISIDDNEQSQLKILCDSIFGEQNYLNTIIWRKTNSPKAQSTNLGNQYESVLVYSSVINKFKINRIYKPFDENSLKPYGYSEGKRKFRLIELEAQGLQKIQGRKSFKFLDREAKYLYSLKTLNEWNDKKIIYKNSNGRYSKKQYLDEMEGVLIGDIWIDEGIKPLQGGSEEYSGFETQKPLSLIKRILKYPQKTDLILDFFAGSGTTGHAVMELNKEDGGNRQYILVTNNENNICEEVTYERLKRVMKGYKNKKGEKVEGLGGNLRYLKCEFVEKTRHTGNMKMRITNACTEMLCLKEGVFEMKKEVTHKGVLYYKIFTGVNATGQVKTFGIYYDLDDEYLDQMREELKALGGEMSAYIFSLAHNPDFINDKRKWKSIDVEEIPEKIIEIYDEIYKTNTRKK